MRNKRRRSRRERTGLLSQEKRSTRICLAPYIAPVIVHAGSIFSMGDIEAPQRSSQSNRFSPACFDEHISPAVWRCKGTISDCSGVTSCAMCGTQATDQTRGRWALHPPQDSEAMVCDFQSPYMGKYHQIPQSFCFFDRLHEVSYARRSGCQAKPGDRAKDGGSKSCGRRMRSGHEQRCTTTLWACAELEGPVQRSKDDRPFLLSATLLTHPRDRKVSQGQSWRRRLPARERNGSPSTPIANRLAANDASVTTPSRSTDTCVRLRGCAHVRADFVAWTALDVVIKRPQKSTIENFLFI